MTKADERRQFRFALVKDILRCESVRKLPHDHKKLLFRWLANGWSITDTPPDTSRIRALEKAASDARRLRAALGRLDAKDTASLDFNYSVKCLSSTASSWWSSEKASPKSFARTII